MASEIDIICLDTSEESDDEKAQNDTVLTPDNWYPKIEQVYTEFTAHMESPVEDENRNDSGETATNLRNDPGETATNFLGISNGKSIEASPSSSSSLLPNFPKSFCVGKFIESSLSPSSSLLPNPTNPAYSLLPNYPKSSSLLPNPHKSFRDEVICPEKSVRHVIPDNIASHSNIDTISSSSMGDSDNDFASDSEKHTFFNESGSLVFTFPKPNSFGQPPPDLPGNCLQSDARRMNGKVQVQGTNQSQSVKDLRTVFAFQMLKDGGTSECSSEAPGCTPIEIDGHYHTEEVSSMTNVPLQNVKSTKIPFEDDEKIIKNKKIKKTSGVFKEIVKPLPNEITTSTKDLKIKKLEEALEKCAKEIKKLDETEVDLDGDEDQSAYVISSRYKERYVQIRQKIADLKMIPNELRRKSDKPFHFRESKYSIVNKKIEEFINRNKAFPDFKDIRKVIRNANAGGNLLPKAQLDAEAEKIFRKVGNKLKSRRLSDDDDVMSSYFPQYGGSPSDDPADKDSHLERKLKNNLKEGQKLIDEFLDGVQEKQDGPVSDGDELESLDGHESDSADNNSDEEDNEIGTENEIDTIGSGSDSEESEKEGRWVGIDWDKAGDKCLSAFENDATIDELLDSDNEEQNVIKDDDCKSSVSSRPDAMANFETTIKFGCNVKNTISCEDKVHSEVKTKIEVLPYTSNVLRTAEDSNASGMFDKMHMEEHVEKAKSNFGENFPNEVIIIDD